MTPTKHRPYVPEGVKMTEFSVKALMLGLVDRKSVV